MNCQFEDISESMERSPGFHAYKFPHSTPFEAMLAKLCANCRLFTVGEREAGRSLQHHRSFATFHDATTYGCSICTRLWARLYPKGDPVPSKDEEDNISVYASFRTASDAEDDEELIGCRFEISRRYSLGLTVDFDLLGDESRSYGGVYELTAIDTLATQDHRHMLQVIDHEIAPSTDSIFTTKLIQHWLFSCQSNHTSCQPTNLQCPLPLRVIDVGTIGQSSVRLLVSGSSPEYGSYITLSHCWGNPNIIKLTIENEPALRAGFPIQDLPKTFRDAIQVTRALSVKYLWIDSLRILQNSVDDWRHQSALMGEIYRNCFCNIAATSSGNSDGGLFFKREPHLLKPLNLTIKWKSGGGLARHGRCYLWDSDLWDRCVRDAPLNRRGWVLQ